MKRTYEVTFRVDVEVQSESAPGERRANVKEAWRRVELDLPHVHDYGVSRSMLGDEIITQTVHAVGKVRRRAGGTER